MIKILKSIFGKSKRENNTTDAPGRTFNKVLTGKYFGCEDVNADATHVAKAKQKKIDQIHELNLQPMYSRYTFEKGEDDFTTSQPSFVHVVFQKEVSPEHRNMVHVTEISFIVKYEDFEEFEKMAGVSLFNDFRQLSNEESPETFKGRDRREAKRN